MWLGTIAQRPPCPSGIALLGKSDEAKHIGPWELCLLAFVAAVGVAYLVVGSRFTGFTYADGAYYYGVARHMALTGRFEEPIVWHFLHPPETLIHAPFDYWGGMTSLLLVPPLAIFGATPATALLTMAAISAASLFAFWYLVCVALPLRHHVAQMLAVVLFAFSPALNLYRFQPESITVAHLFILLSLIAFCRRRFTAAVLGAFCIVLTRGDGVVLFSFVFFAALFAAHDDCPPRHWRILLVGLGCIATYVLWSIASFGTLTPPAARLVPFLDNYWQVYDYGVARRGLSWVELADHLTAPYLLQRLKLAFDTLRTIRFTPALDAWLILAVAALPSLLRRRRRPELLIWILCFGGYFLLACINGAGFAPVRTPYTFAPLVVLAGALGVDAIASRLEAWTRRDTSRISVVVIGLGVLALCFTLLRHLPALRRMSYRVGATVAMQKKLSGLDRVLRGEPVATNRPWDLIAYTRSPSVSIPRNGLGSLQAVLLRYDVRFLVLFNLPRRPKRPRKRPGRDLFAEIVANGRAAMGPFRFERVPVDAGLPVVVRVERIPRPGHD